MSTSSDTLRGCFCGAQNHAPLARMVTLISGGNHQRYEPGRSLARLPRSRPPMSGQRKASGDVGRGTTLHSVVRPTPPSLPTQRTSGPLQEITAFGCSLWIMSVSYTHLRAHETG